MATLSTDPYTILLGHDRWATRTLLERTASLSHEEFHQRFDIGPGSLHDTLTHIVGAVRRWADRIGERPLRPSIDGAATGSPVNRTPAELLAIWEDATADFAAVIAQQRPRFAETRDWVFGNESYRFTVAAAVIHVSNHGMHHRSQCFNMFRRLGKPINADLDEVEWQLAGEP